MKLLFLEPFFGGSHKQWIEGYKRHSTHEIVIYSLPDRFWKWRMYGAAITFADMLNTSEEEFDLIIASDMLNVATFKSLLVAEKAQIPIFVYFHENQLTYPWSPTDEDVKLGRDQHYAFMNYVSALSSNRVLFNSFYHKDSFLSALEPFLKQFPDFNNFNSIATIANKSAVLELGLDLDHLKCERKTRNDIPIILWNHRWEYDKNPETFFELLFELSEAGYAFRLVVLGEKSESVPPIFSIAKEKLNKHIDHWGYCKSRDVYESYLKQADILPVTSKQDFFGISTLEAIVAGATPLLPNRLAYPEVFEYGNHSSFFYENDGQLIVQLKALLSNRETRILDVDFLIEKFDWKKRAVIYDDFFNAILA